MITGGSSVGLGWKQIPVSVGPVLIRPESVEKSKTEGTLCVPSAAGRPLPDELGFLNEGRIARGVSGLPEHEAGQQQETGAKQKQ